jgi:HSP20 family molecular chaperone IbpA
MSDGPDIDDIKNLLDKTSELIDNNRDIIEEFVGDDGDKADMEVGSDDPLVDVRVKEDYLTIVVEYSFGSKPEVSMEKEGSSLMLKVGSHIINVRDVPEGTRINDPTMAYNNGIMNIRLPIGKKKE